MFDPLSITRYWKDLHPSNLEKIKETNGHFIDETFPPNENSLLSKNSKGEYNDRANGAYYEMMLNYLYPPSNHQWKRVRDIKKGEWKLFEGKIEFEDVKQGSLGDCYFLSAISALTKYPNLLIEKFRTTKYTDIGYYEVVLFVDGEWQIVFVDDYYPIDGDEFPFAKPNNNELWAILLEKAWAKVNGGYSNIIGGIVSEVLLALTGFPSEYIQNLSGSISPISLFEKIKQASEDGALMGCGSYPNSRGDGSQANELGIIYSHNYTLIEAKGINEDDIYLLKIRNPWGNVEWQGDWSDKSEKWTDKYKKIFHHEDKEDGIFWMSIDDYVKNYNDTSICHIFYGAKVRSYTIDCEEYFKHPLVFNLHMVKKGKMGISLLVRDRRFNRNIDVREDHPFSLLIFKYDDNRRISNFKGLRGWFQNIEINEELDEGYYLIWIYLPYEFISLGDNFKYTLSFISKEDFKSKFIAIDKEFQTIRKLLIEHYKSQNEFEIASCNQFIISCPQDIHGNTNLSPFIMYNSTGSNLEFNFDFSQTNGYTNLIPYKNQAKFTVVLPPDGYDVIIRTRTGISNLSLGYTVTPVFNSDHPQTTEEVSIENQMRFDFDDDNKEETTTIKSQYYRFIEMKKAEEIPVFDATEVDTKKENVYMTVKEIKEKYHIEYNLLCTYFLSKNSITLPDDDYWIIETSEKGTLLCQQSDNDNDIYAIVFFANSNKKYIGEWTFPMTGRGIIFDEKNNKVFEGNFEEGKAKGEGTYYYSPNEYITGTFIDNKINGVGRYHFANGNVWEGDIVNGKKNGMGVMTYKNGTQNLVEYNNDIFMGDDLIDTPAKYESNKTKSLQLKSKRGIQTCMKAEKPMIKKEAVKGISFGGDVKDEIEKAKILDEIKEKERFMFWEITTLDNIVDVRTMKLIVENSYKFLYCTTEKENDLIGGYFDGNFYYFGHFDRDKKPHGLIRKYGMSKRIIFEGQMNGELKFIDGEGTKYFDNGEVIKGYVKEGKINGKGVLSYLNGNFIVGSFIDDTLIRGSKGKMYIQNENELYNVIIGEKNEIASKEKIDYSAKIMSIISNDTLLSSKLSSEAKSLIEKYIKFLYRYYSLNSFSTPIVKLKEQDEIYIGEADNNKKNGIGVVITQTSTKNLIYIGYHIDNKRSHYGIVLSHSLCPIYIGSFYNGEYSGYGELTTPKYKYQGYFSSGVPHGYGEKTFNSIKNIKCKGIFYNSFEKYIHKIDINNNSISLLKYENGNIIGQGTITLTTAIDYIRMINQKRKQISLSRYAKYIDRVLSMEQTSNDIDILMDIRYGREGVYIGEVNIEGKKQGRGIIVNLFNDYVFEGEFQCDRKIKGVLYDNKGNVIDKYYV